MGYTLGWGEVICVGKGLTWLEKLIIEILMGIVRGYVRDHPYLMTQIARVEEAIAELRVALGELPE